MESKSGKIRRVKYGATTLSILTSLVFRGLAMLSVVFLGLPNSAIAREIHGQVFIVTKDGKSIRLGSVEVFAYNRSDVERAIKQVDEKLKARREAVRSGNTDNLVKKASDARKEAGEKQLQHPEDESLRAASEQASNLEKDVLEFAALARRRRNYLLSSQPYFTALPSPVARTKTDADGNFALDVPLVGSFVIGARTHRNVGDKIEHYAWLVTIDNAGSQKLILSDGNLTSAGGEHSLLKTEGNEDDAEDSSREQAEVLKDKIVRQIEQRDAQTRSEARAVPSLPDDFKTINGKEYKNATVSRVEPDGIVLRTKSGITKVYFTELPKEVQERFHYDSAKSAKSNAPEQAAAAQSNAAAGQEQQQQQHAEWHYQDIQDPMGRHGPERHAFVKSADGNAKLSLSWDGQTATVSLTTVNVMSSDEYYATIITMRMDDRPAYDYELHIDRESFRYGLIAYARPAYGEWSQFSPGDFITGLKSTHILRVEVPIHGQGSIVYTFPVEGLVW